MIDLTLDTASAGRRIPSASPIDLPEPIPEDPLPSSTLSSRKTVEVCVQLTFQNGSHKKHGSDMQRLCCNIIRNLNLVHIIRTYTEHYHYAQTKYTHVRHSKGLCFQKAVF